MYELIMQANEARAARGWESWKGKGVLEVMAADLEDPERVNVVVRCKLDHGCKGKLVQVFRKVYCSTSDRCMGGLFFTPKINTSIER